MTSNQGYPIQAKIVTFLYHEVTDYPERTGFDGKSALPYKHEVLEFDNNLHEIRKSPIPLSLVNEIDFRIPARHLLLTFDDGGKSAMTIADAIEKHGWKGHFFITTSMIGTPTFLSVKDIQELHHRGHIIGSHSHTHPNVFYNLNYDEMIKEWKVSADILSNIIQDDIFCASVPGGEMDLNTQKSAQAVGFRFLFTSEPTRVPWKLDNLLCLGRVCPKKGTPLSYVYNFAHHKGFGKELAIRTIKNTVKKIYFPVRKAFKGY